MKHSMGFLGESVGIFFFCVAKEALESICQRAESKFISLKEKSGLKKKLSRYSIWRTILPLNTNKKIKKGKH